MSARDKQVGGSHYKDMAIQPGEFIRANDIGWYEGNAIKYICRHKKKGQKQDLEKAIHYIELAMAEYDEEGEFKEIEELYTLAWKWHP